MKKNTTYIVLLLLLWGFSQPLKAQLVVDDTQTIEAVIQSLVGEGITISNIQKTCPDGAWGAFLGEDSNLGMPKGLIMTSGKIQNAQGPNNSGSSSESNLAPGDTDLDGQIVGFTTQDACVITFDLQAIADTIQFRYIFGSEEYLEYVGSNFNDVFAFFITGPNPAGGNYNTENIAIVPGTTTPVSINNVNDNSYSEYYVENGDGFSSPENTDDFYIQYDGFTTVLTARAAVVPCQTYTLKLAVADAGDTALDSGVFIEAGSLTTNKIELSATTSLADLGFTNAVEGCIDAIIQFKPSGNILDTTIVYFSLTGTAQNGIDYTDENGLALPDSIILYPGDTLAQITLSPIADGINEGLETVDIEITNTNFCTTIVDTVEVRIQDNIIANAQPANTTACAGTPVQLIGSGGVTSQWVPADFLNNPNIASPIATPTQSIEYTYITTIGPCVDSTTVNIIMDDNFQPDVPADYLLCPGQTATLTANGATFLQWSPGTNLSCTSCPNPVFSGTESTTYSVTMYDMTGCSQVFPVNVVFGNGDLGVRDSTINVCAGSQTALTLGSPSANYTITPATGLSCSNCYNPTLTATQNTTYQINANISGCEQNGTWTVNVTPISADAGQDIIGCETIETTLGSPATAGTSYQWLPATNLSAANVAQPNLSINTTSPINQNYTLVVTNANGCSATDVINVMLTVTPQLNIAQPDTLFEGNTTTLTATGAPTNATYQWSPTDNLSKPNEATTQASPSQTTTYTLTVNTPEGCEAITTVTIPVIEPPKLLLPSSFSPNNDGVNDILRLVGRDVSEILSFEVYNRWGERVFESNNIADGWDGTYRAQPQMVGTYAYVVKYRYTDSEVKTIKGNVTLIR
jgi:gliding motility-associated-like protein